MTMNYETVNSVALLVSLYNIQKIYVILVHHCINQWSKANTFVTVIPRSVKVESLELTHQTYSSVYVKKIFLSTLLT